MLCVCANVSIVVHLHVIIDRIHKHPTEGIPERNEGASDNQDDEDGLCLAKKLCEDSHAD